MPNNSYDPTSALEQHSTFSKESFWIINKPIAFALKSIEAALLYVELLDMFKHFYDKEKLENGWFFAKVERIERGTMLSEHKQRKAASKLVEAGLLEIKREGINRPNWFRFPEERGCLKFLSTAAEKISVDIYSNTKNISKTSTTSKEVVNNFEDEVGSSSDSSNRTSQEKAKRLHPVNEYIERFCEDPNTPTHRRTSKLYAAAAKKISQLKRGTFFNKHRQLCTDWNGTKHWKPDFKWSKQELMDAIERTALYFSPDHWPRDKSRIPQNLDTLIYNPQTKKSWLIAAYYHPPKKITVPEVELEGKQVEAADSLVKLLPDCEPNNVKRFVLRFWKWFKKDVHENFRRNYRGPFGCFLRFRVYVDWRVNPKLTKLTMDGVTWKRWLHWIGEDGFTDPMTGKRVE